MLPQRYRLPLRELHHFFSLARKKKTPFFVAYSLKQNSIEKKEKGFSRFVIVVSKKIVAKASQRAKIKRKVRTIIVSTIGKTPAGFDVVLRVTRNIAEIDQETLKKEIFVALEQ